MTKIMIYLHLVTIVPVILMGPYILLKKKGNRLHKLLGRVWALLMIVSCLLSFGIRGPDGNLSWLHGLAALTIYSVIIGIRDARKGNMNSHKRNMIGPYIGAIIAMLFAFANENRLLGRWLNSLL